MIYQPAGMKFLKVKKDDFSQIRSWADEVNRSPRLKYQSALLGGMQGEASHLSETRTFIAQIDLILVLGQTKSCGCQEGTYHYTEAQGRSIYSIKVHH